MARSLMVFGTGSSVGMSLLTAALLRVFRQDGWSFDRLADHVRAAFDVPALASWIAAPVSAMAAVGSRSGGC